MHSFLSIQPFPSGDLILPSPHLRNNINSSTTVLFYFLLLDPQKPRFHLERSNFIKQLAAPAGSAPQHIQLTLKGTAS